MKKGEPAEDRASQVARARALHDQHAWMDAYQAFVAADQAEPLAAQDLERMSTAAGLSNLVPEALATLERAYEAHLERGQALRAARASFWLGLRLFSLGEHARASGWLSRAQRLVDGKDCAERGYLLLPAIRRHEQSGDYAAAQALAAEAQAIGDRFGDKDLSAFARVLQGNAMVRHGRVEPGLALVDDAMLAATSGKLSPIITGLTYCTAITTCQHVFALGRGREWTSALRAWCDQQPQLSAFTGQCRVHRSEIMQLGGAWEDAIDEARQVADAVRRDPGAVGDALYQQAEIHRLRGEIAEAERAYRGASEHGREPHPGLSLLWLRSGRAEAAAGALRRLLAATTGSLRRARYLPATVEVMLAVGAADEAEAAAAELEEIAARFGTEVLGALAAHARGAVELQAGRAPAAVEPLRRAFRTWQQVGAPYLAARVRLLLAQSCRALGDHETAKLERELAIETLARLGAALDPEPGASEEGRPGAPAGLTARELEVLRLVATGKTNKSIGRELFISEKTVDRHVSNIFSKVNVASRAAATAYAYEHHLV